MEDPLLIHEINCSFFGLARRMWRPGGEKYFTVLPVVHLLPTSSTYLIHTSVTNNFLTRKDTSKILEKQEN